MGYLDIDVYPADWIKSTLKSDEPQKIPRYSIVNLIFQVEPKILEDETIMTKFKIAIRGNIAKISEMTQVLRERRVFLKKRTFSLSTEKDFTIEFTDKCNIELSQYGSRDSITVNIGETNITVKSKGGFTYIYP